MSYKNGFYILGSLKINVSEKNIQYNLLKLQLKVKYMIYMDYKWINK